MLPPLLLLPLPAPAWRAVAGEPLRDLLARVMVLVDDEDAEPGDDGAGG